jgi:FtsH-binding integral membrane protein
MMTRRDTQMVKMGFLRKVYGILSIQLLATAIVCAMAMKMTSSELVSRTPVPVHVLYFLLRVVSPILHEVFPLPNVIYVQTLNLSDMCPIRASCTL